MFQSLQQSNQVNPLVLMSVLQGLMKGNQQGQNQQASSMQLVNFSCSFNSESLHFYNF